MRMKKIEEMLNRRWINWLDGVYLEKYTEKRDELSQKYIADNQLRVNSTVEIVKNFFERNSINLKSKKVGNIGYSSFDQLLRTEFGFFLLIVKT